MTKEVAVFSSSNTDVTTMDVESLKKEFVECLELTEASIRRMADIAAQLYKMGEELPKVKDAFLSKWIGKIAGGLIHEKVFVQYCANTNLLKKLENVPLKDQLEIAEGEKKILVATIKNGEATVVSKTAEELSRTEIARAFSDTGFRSVEDQKKLLEKPLGKLRKNQNKTLFIDPSSKYLKLSNSFVCGSDGRKFKASDLVKALSEFYEVDIEKFIMKNAEKID